jgi:hypothetical protein
MSVTSICCNKELGATCLWCCDNRYCTNIEAITYNPIDMSCSEYLDRAVFRNVLKGLEDHNGNNTCV